ncbi:MAG: hypothetical protein DRO40_08750 [Thermoprotei archaeon]|nr:MAG: hypothetical protein DRO40_08750 [Thermoprotei archaeon]
MSRRLTVFLIIGIIIITSMYLIYLRQINTVSTNYTEPENTSSFYGDIPSSYICSGSPVFIELINSSHYVWKANERLWNVLAYPGDEVRLFFSIKPNTSFISCLVNDIKRLNIDVVFFGKYGPSHNISVDDIYVEIRNISVNKYLIMFRIRSGASEGTRYVEVGIDITLNSISTGDTFTIALEVHKPSSS